MLGFTHGSGRASQCLNFAAQQETHLPTYTFARRLKEINKEKNEIEIAQLASLTDVSTSHARNWTHARSRARRASSRARPRSLRSPAQSRSAALSDWSFRRLHGPADAHRRHRLGTLRTHSQ